MKNLELKLTKTKYDNRFNKDSASCWKLTGKWIFSMVCWAYFRKISSGNSLKPHKLFLITNDKSILTVKWVHFTKKLIFCISLWTFTLLINKRLLYLQLNSPFQRVDWKDGKSLLLRHSSESGNQVNEIQIILHSETCCCKSW